MNDDIRIEAMEQLLRKPVVLEKTGLPNSTLYYLINRGDFPSPVKLGVRSSAWLRSEVEVWINSRKRSIFVKGVENDEV